MNREEEQEGGEAGGCGEHLSVRNTPSDTDVIAEHQMRAGRVSDPGRRTCRTTQNSAGQRDQGKTRSWYSWTCPRQAGN